MPRLTKRFIDTLKPSTENKDEFFWDTGDGSVKGFGVRMKPSGSASYIVQYRNTEGRTRRMVVGKIGVLPPEQARQQAIMKLQEVNKGADPSAERHAIRSSLTVSDLCDLYLKDAEGRIKASTLAMDKSRIECHVKPLLGRMSVKSLRVEDIEMMQTAIAAGKTAKKRKDSGRTGSQKGGKGVAARTVGMFSTILEFARRRKLITENPARDVKKYADNKKRRFLSHEEIRALGVILHNANSDAMNGKPPLANGTALAAIRALLLTGCRKNEILALPWNWLDLRAKCIRFEDTKSGAQLRPIGCAAIDTLTALPRPSSWVFPASRGDGHFVGLAKVFQRICDKAGIKDCSLHTLRHTFAAIAAEMGYSELTIAGLLGHSVAGVTARYAHVPDAALVSAADRISLIIAGLLDGRTEEQKVIPMRAGL